MVQFSMRDVRASRVERIRRRRFERLVARALRDLPDHIHVMLNNVAIIVEDEPSPDQLREMDGDTLFGLYQGVPLTERDGGYSMALPDKVTIFRRPIEAACATPREIEEEVRVTVIHELAHHLGLEEDRLEELGWQ